MARALELVYLLVTVFDLLGGSGVLGQGPKSRLSIAVGVAKRFTVFHLGIMFRPDAVSVRIFTACRRLLLFYSCYYRSHILTWRRRARSSAPTPSFLY